MVDVSEKPQTQRTATAEGVVRLNSETFKKVVAGRIKKGDVLAGTSCWDYGSKT